MWGDESVCSRRGALFQERAIERLKISGQGLFGCDQTIADIAVALVENEDLVTDAELVEALGIELTISGCDESVLSVVVP